MSKIILILVLFTSIITKAQTPNFEPQTGTYNTIADLRASNGDNGTTVHVNGFYTPFDGGGGNFVRDATSTAISIIGMIEPTTGVSTGRWVRKVTEANSFHTSWFGLKGDGTDESVAFQTAINVAQTYKAHLFVDKRTTYKVNITISGQINIDFNYCNLIPAADSAVITLLHGSLAINISNIAADLTVTNRAWHHADFIYINGIGNSQDQTEMTNITARNGPAYGVYAIGASPGGHTIQRLRCRDITMSYFQYAGLRLEGTCLENTFDNCFWNSNCKLGALPAISVTSGHPISPAREFRRASVELLQWVDTLSTVGDTTGVDTTTDGVDLGNQHTPNRNRFLGGTMNPYQSLSLTPDNSPGGFYIEGGNTNELYNVDIEAAHRAVWANRLPGQLDGDYSVAANTLIIHGCTFLLSVGNKNGYTEVIKNSGYRNLIIENNFFRGGGGASTYAVVLNDWNGSQNQNIGPLETYLGNKISNFSIRDTSAYRGREVKYTATAYAKEWTMNSSIAIGRYEIPMQGVHTFIKLSNITHPICAVRSENDAFYFMDGTHLTLSAITDSLNPTIVNNSDNGINGSLLAGRFLLTGGANITITSNSQSIDFIYHSEDSSWHQSGANFQTVNSVNILGVITDLHTSPLQGGVYQATPTTTNVPSGWGTASGIATISNNSSNNIFTSSTSGINETIILTRSNANRIYYQSYIGSTNTWSGWDSAWKTGDDINPENINVTGTTGAGFMELKSQTVAPVSGATNGIRIYNISGNLAWKKTLDGFERRFTSTLTADRVYTWPDASTTVVGTDVTQTLTNKTFGAITFTDGVNIGVGTTTGTKFGTATNQKIGFYNSTPIVQPSGSIITALTNLGLVATPTIQGSELTLNDVTTNNASTSAHGFAPKYPNDATKYLDGTGAYSVPGGGASNPLSGSVATTDFTTTSATLTDVTGMSIAVTANKKYRLTAVLWVGCSTANGLKFAVNGPTGTALLSGVIAGSNTSNIATKQSRLTTIGTASIAYNTFAGTTGMVTIIGYITTSSTTGNVTIQIDSVTGGDTSSVYIGSTFDLQQVQ